MPEVHLIMHLCLALVGDTSTGLGGKNRSGGSGISSSFPAICGWWTPEVEVDTQLLTGPEGCFSH